MGSSASEPYAFGDPLNQKDQTVHVCFQGTNAIDQLVGAPFKPGQSGLEGPQSVGQIVFECDHSAGHTGDVVLQAVQSPCDELRRYRLVHFTRPKRPKMASSSRLTSLMSLFARSRG